MAGAGEYLTFIEAETGHTMEKLFQVYHMSTLKDRNTPTVMVNLIFPVRQTCLFSILGVFLSLRQETRVCGDSPPRHWVDMQTQH